MLAFDEPCHRRVRPVVHLERTPHGVIVYVEPVG
jgi:hypothetical protein